MRRPQVANIRRKPQKVLHSSCTGQKWSIFINYISDLLVADIMVGERGFEPPTPWSQTRCATRLRYSPTPLALHGSSRHRNRLQATARERLCVSRRSAPGVRRSTRSWATRGHHCSDCRGGERRQLRRNYGACLRRVPKSAACDEP